MRAPGSRTFAFEICSWMGSRRPAGDTTKRASGLQYTAVLGVWKVSPFAISSTADCSFIDSRRGRFAAGTRVTGLTGGNHIDDVTPTGRGVTSSRCLWLISRVAKIGQRPCCYTRPTYQNRIRRVCFARRTLHSAQKTLKATCFCIMKYME